MVKIQNEVYIGYWNVRSMYEEMTEKEVIGDIKEKDIKLCIITEGHWVGNGVRKVEDYYVLYSGHSKNHIEGVGFVMHGSMYEAWKQDGGCWQPISSRIATIRIPIKGKRYLTIVGVYAFTNVAGREEATDALYDELQSVWDGIPKGDVKMLAGDFNARVGGYDEGFSKVIGRYGIGEINDNGRVLREFCDRNDIAVMDTFFPHKEIHLYTWMDRYKNRYTLDHLLVQGRWKGCIRDVRTVQHSHRTTADHRLVRVNMSLSFMMTKGKRGSRGVVIDKGKLKTPIALKEYQGRMDNLVFQSTEDTSSFDSRFEDFRDGVIKSYKGCFRKVGGQRKKSYISDSTMQLIQEKKVKFLVWEAIKQEVWEWRKIEVLDKFQEARNEMERSTGREYRSISNRVKRAVERDKTHWIEGKISELESLRGVNNPSIFKEIDRLFKSTASSSIPIKDDNGDFITTEKGRMDQWGRWGKGVFNVEVKVSGVVEEVPRPVEWEEETAEVLKERSEVPSIKEIASMIAKLGNNKASDRKETVAEMLKRAGEGSLIQISNIIREMWLHQVRPEAWGIIDIVPIYKGKGDAGVCDNYRPISIIDMFSKAFGNLLKGRLEKAIEGKLLEAQAGFRKGRSTRDMIYILRMLRGYSKEVRQAVYGCFVDLRKAYDSIDRETLWKVLRVYGIEGNLLEMIKLLYKDLKASIRVGDGRTEEFDIKAGVKQGCVLSPILFNIYLDFVVRRAIERFDKMGAGILRGEEGEWIDPIKGGRRESRGRDLGLAIISALLYADDTALLASSYHDLCLMIKVLDEVTQEWGLTISIPKTKIMVWQAPKDEVRETMILRGEVVDEVEEFKYLGSVFTSEGGDIRDVDVRISRAWAAFHKLKKRVWRQKAFSIATKIKVYKMTVVPTILYGAESWTLSEVEEERLETTQMRMLRSIMRISLKEHKTNVEIREMAGVVAIRDLVRRSRLSWFGDVMRMEDSRWPKLTMCGYLAEHNGRGRGRPPLRWSDKVKKDIEQMKVDPKTCIPLVKDVGMWLRTVKGNDSNKQVKGEEDKQRVQCDGCKRKFKKAGLSLHHTYCKPYKVMKGIDIVEQEYTCEQEGCHFKTTFKRCLTTHTNKHKKEAEEKKKKEEKKKARKAGKGN